MRRWGETPPQASERADTVRSVPVSRADRLLGLTAPREPSWVISPVEDHDRDHHCTQDEQHAQGCERSNRRLLDVVAPTPL